MKLSVDGCIRRSIYVAFAAGFVTVAIPAHAQDSGTGEKPVQLEAVRVTGTRIAIPGATSSSPIVTVRAEEFSLQQTPEVEQVLRNLPSTLPGDGQNVNNGSIGAATVNLRGLGEQRNLILVDGKRVTPYDINGVVDTSVIPTALLERVDLVTGGASAVYGSDAMSGAINFIMKRNFQGVDIDYTNGITEEGDGDKTNIQMTMGTNVAGGKGNIAVALTYAHRDGVQLGARPLGNLGIVTNTGGGLADFRAGRGPAAAPADCQGDGAGAVSTASGGSSTTLPTRIALVGVTGTAQQFRDDGSLGANCSLFNFNPFNYYQTPQDRYGGAVFGRFEFNEHAEAYGRFLYSNTSVRQQVAPSGIFATNFFIPLNNPYLTTSAQNNLIAQGNTARTGGRLNRDANMNGMVDPSEVNWRDTNSNGVVDAPDYLNYQVRRRTVELGERSTTNAFNAYQFAVGTRGNIIGDWDYDVSFQRGQSDLSRISAGYTNLANIPFALDAGGTAANPVCNNAAAVATGCVPLNIFSSGEGITDAQKLYSSSTALELRSYVQYISNATVNGSFNLTRPFATRPIGLSFGVERRREEGSTTPDECLRLQPTSCQGGAGGFSLPIVGGFHVDEVFSEAIIPLVDGKFLARALDLEVGYRWSDFDPSGITRTWKYGFTWAPVDGLVVRAMHQRAARAPNVGELAAPQTTGLDNAGDDPCADKNDDGIRDVVSAEVAQRCVNTGVAAADVGLIEDFTAGQINGFFGTDLDNLPKPEKADTNTFGVAWRPKNMGLVRNAYLSLDYYDIKITDYIGTLGAQEVLDGCYIQGRTSECAKVRRVNGGLATDGSGVELFTTNLKYLKAEGVELATSFDVLAGKLGKFKLALNANYYLTQESLSSNEGDLVDCNGFYGNTCGNPLPKLRMIQRTTWSFKDFDTSLLWRYIGKSDIETAQTIDPDGAGTEEIADSIPAFQHIGSYSYFDMSVGYTFKKNYKVSFLATNLFERDPPVLGNEAGTTASNSGNTFPSVYDPLGRTYSLSVGLTF